MKYILYSILFLLAIPIFFMREIESIPSNAKIIVFNKKHTWVPDNQEGNELLNFENHENSDSYFIYLDSHERTTYKEIENGLYKGFIFDEKLGKLNNFTTGYNVSPIYKLIFGSKNRWNEDGSWNY